MSTVPPTFHEVSGPSPQGALGDFRPPFPVQFKRNALAYRVLRLWGWDIHFEGLPGRQGVIVVYPHTSNWDFVVGITAKWALGIPIQFWGKDTLFKVPLFGHWLRWLGGIPVVRSVSSGLVESAVAALKQARQDDAMMWVVLAPEGTRRRTEGWRSGFYQTVVLAQVPLGLAHLDFAKKRVVLLDFVTLTGDKAHDMGRIRAAYADTVGMHASQASPVDLVPQRPKPPPTLPSA